SRGLTHLAGNLINRPAASNDHTAQPETKPDLNRFALKPLALGRYDFRYLGYAWSCHRTLAAASASNPLSTPTLPF
ncbi:MAG: hypothetical protein ACRDOH_29830, partial [Streptosporangiaceae bacterium]